MLTAVVTGAVGAALLVDGLVNIAPASAAQSSVGLGTATSFAVLAGQTVTNTGASVISGDLGVSPGTAVTGFPPGIVVNGTQHAADAVALQAQSDLTTAYNDAAGRTPATAVSTDLGGQTLAPGVYKAAGALGLTGTVTLDAHGDSSAVFIFQVGSMLTTASNSTVNVIGSAQACNVFWQVGSSATLGTNTSFVGSVLALTSASVQTGTTVSGRVLARNGQVSLDTNTITRPGCAAAVTPPSSSASTSRSPSPTASHSATATSTARPTSSTSPSTTASGGAGAGPTVRPSTSATARPSPSRTTTAGPAPTGNGTVLAGPGPTRTHKASTAPPRTAKPGAPGGTSPGTGVPTPTGTGGSRTPGAIPPGFPQTGAGGAAPRNDGNSGPLIAAGAIALLGSGAAAGQAIRRRRGSAVPA